MEEEEVSGVLAQEVPARVGQTADSRSPHIEFIRRISSDHPEYGEDRIALKLEVKFAVRHASSTVRRYMVKRRPCSNFQAWRSFLKNQAKGMWTCDFFVQHTIGFRVLYVFIIMELSSRKLIHFNPLSMRGCGR